jgi:hypothetical protein
VSGTGVVEAEPRAAARVSTGWTDSRAVAAVVAFVAAVAIAAATWIYAGHLTYYGGQPIRSDGFGYYVYLPAVFLDHDLTLRKTGARSFNGDPSNIPGVNWVRTAVPAGEPGQHEPFDQFAVGEAVMMLPFFGAGDVLAIATGAERNGFTWPYQAAAVVSAMTYVLLGLLLTASVLLRFFSRRTVVITILALAFGAAVVEYATYDVTYSHGYSFFLTALVMRLALAVWQRPRALTAAALGASIGLAGLVRLPSLDILAFAALIGIERPADLLRRVRTLLRHLGLVALGIAAALLALLPQVGYWYRITKRLLVYQYHATGEHLHPGRPHLLDVLFSVRKGFFFWTPLMILAVAGLPLLRRRAAPLFVPAIAYLAAATWVIASWSSWAYGASYGMRALIDTTPVFALGLAALVESAKAPVARRAVAAALALTTVLAIHGMLAYWLKAIPPDRTTLHEYVASFRTWW